MRICLIFGSVDLFISVIFSFFMLMLIPETLINQRFLVIMIYNVLVPVVLLVSLIKSSKNHVGVKKHNEIPTFIIKLEKILKRKI